MRKFDLNIEEILDDWEVYHAIREVLANALDEQKITRTQEVKTYKDELGTWHIRDYGRGIQEKHLTQNEDEEKLNRNDVIGKFGIGLKDSLAVFHRKGIEVEILSKYNKFTIGMSEKNGFEDIITLHVYVSEPKMSEMRGTDVRLKGIEDKGMNKAKNLFLEYSDEKILETTKYGQIIQRKNALPAKIYINGLQISSEENFLFSYNITNLTDNIRKELNRERNNLGRGTYAYRVKKILQASKSEKIIDMICTDFERIERGDHHDELGYKDLQTFAIKHINANKNVVFLTKEEMEKGAGTIDNIKRTERKIVQIPSRLSSETSGMTDVSGEKIWTGNHFLEKINDDFNYDFINEEDLDPTERKTFKFTEKIIAIFGNLPAVVKDIKIAKSLKQSSFGINNHGIWDPKEELIIIEREQLKNLENYSGTLIHELIHAKTGKEDVTRDFELELTNIIGNLAYHLLKKT